MDLRSLGSISDSVKYIVGGMVANQEVTNQNLRLERSGIFTAVEEIEVPTDFLLFPNPVSDRLYLRSESYIVTGASYEVYNTLGLLVKKGKYDAEGITVSHLATGMYWLQLKANDSSMSYKFNKL